MKLSKKLLSLLLCAIMVLGSVAVGGEGFAGVLDAFNVKASAASSGTCGDNLTWNLSDDGVLTISGTGAMYDYKRNSMPWYSIKNSIETVVIGNGVTSIGNWAFGYCTGLTSVTIPNSVKSINAYAFSECTGIKSITIPDGVTSIGEYAFSACTGLTSITIPVSVTSIGNFVLNDCKGLTSVKIPNSVTSIGNYAFLNCTGLKSITIPDSVTYIGEGTFKFCSGLTSITIPNSVTSIGYDAFYKCTGLTSVTIPNSVTSFGSDVFYGCTGLESAGPIGSGCDYEFGWKDAIPSYAFYECYTLKSITIPDSITSIGEQAFGGCNGLTNITIPDSVTSIGSGAFESIGITSITIPDSVTSIGARAFENCGRLKSLTVPDSVTSIGVAAFHWCTSLTNVTISNSVTSIGERAFYECYTLKSISVDPDNKYYSSDSFGVLFNKDKTELIQYPIGSDRTNYTIPDGVTSIGDYAFEFCSSLTSVAIPDGVTSIGINALRECQCLTSVNIPNSVTSIGDSAFEDCSGLTSITIPNSVTSIGQSAFYGCANLAEINLPCNLKYIEYAAFYDCSSLLSISIPDGVTSINANAFGRCANLTSVFIPESVTEIGRYAFCSEVHMYIEGGSIGIYNPDLVFYGYPKTYAQEYAKNEGIPFIPLIKGVIDNKTGITLSSINGFGKNASLSVEETSDSNALTILQNSTSVENSIIFDIKYLENGAEAQPDGTVTVKIPLPDGYDSANTFVYHVDTKAEKSVNMNARHENGFMVFETDHFSYYAVVENAAANAQIKVAPAQKIDFRSIVTITATAADVPEEYKLAIYLGSQKVAEGDNKSVTYEYGELKSDLNYTVKVIDANGRVQKDSNGNELSKDGGKITVNAGFFKKLIAFFKGLFKSLPKVEVKP